ncbi:hypothetical protein T02_2226 [Trichinella nativa]|uniref:Uncharacterized protein n=1 Tax=Trichinella nativa TaxID=6335 RepID=A0A0V1LEI5_9BILA|nr:hypothetical protein T02_2226 [Trichinella nativa]
MLGWSSSDVQACTSRIKRHVNTGDKDDSGKIKGQQEPKVKQPSARRPAWHFCPVPDVHTVYDKTTQEMLNRTIIVQKSVVGDGGSSAA